MINAQTRADDTNLEPARGKAKAVAISPSLMQIDDVPGLPRVLLIGDSISMGYTLPVRARLAGKANIHHPPENCGPSNRGVANLDQWLGDKHWDVIHFNFGLHDLKYLDQDGNYTYPSKGTVVATPDAYADNLRTIVKRLLQTKAKLVFATTTPVPPDTLGRIKDSEKIYNEKAVAVMKEFDIPVDDLGGYVEQLQATLPPLPPKPHGKAKPTTRPGDIQQPYNVHFTNEGYARLTDLVVASIEKWLPAVKAAK